MKKLSRPLTLVRTTTTMETSTVTTPMTPPRPKPSRSSQRVSGSMHHAANLRRLALHTAVRLSGPTGWQQPT